MGFNSEFKGLNQNEYFCVHTSLWKKHFEDQQYIDTTRTVRFL